MIAILCGVASLAFGAAVPQRASANATAVMFCPGNMGYPDGLTTAEINGYRASGMNTMVLFSMSVAANGDFMYGGKPIVQNGAYNGPSNWPGLLSQCRTAPSSVGRIEMCIGGWGDASFANIKNRIAADGTGSGSVVYRNLQALKNGLGIDAIDYDDEQTYDSGSAVSFGNMVGAVGMKVTLCPYTNAGYWQAVKAGVGAVDAIYLQCYDGGAGDDPGVWNNYFGGMKVIPGYWDWERDTTFLNKMAAWKNNGSIGGFLWPSNTGGNPPADGNEMLQYANWIHSSLDSNTTSNYNVVASENQTVNFNTPVDVAYGANSSYFFKYDIKGSFTFSNATFGGDPIFGVAKSGLARSFWPSVSEGNTANFALPVEVAYGANGSYLFKWGTSGSVAFTNASFGGDPIPNVAKAGYVMPYTQCSGENGSVNFTSPADIAYGANGHYVFRRAFTGTITFNNATFGDPISGAAKGGYYRPSH